MAEAIPAGLIIDAIKVSLGAARAHIARGGGAPRHDHLGWVLTVPDTYQRTVLDGLARDPALRLVTLATEDEAFATAAGLWIGGEPSLLVIQHVGVFAAANTLRGVAIDGKMPIFSIVGQYLREPGIDPRASRHSAVRLVEPLLDTLGVPYGRLEAPADVPRIIEYHRLALERLGPTAVLVGLETV